MKMLFLTSLLFLSACTTSVYKPFDDLIGYSDEVVDREEGIYKIGYVGHEWITNSKAEQEKVIDYTLLRSAEVALLNGFRFFIIIENNSEARKIVKKSSQCGDIDPLQDGSCERFLSIGEFKTKNFKNLDEQSIMKKSIQIGDYQNYDVFQAELVIRVLRRKYQMTSSINLPGLSEGSDWSSISSSDSIEKIDAAPHRGINP